MLLGLLLFGAVLVFFLTQTRLPAVLSKLPTLGDPASARGDATFGSVLDPNAMAPGLEWFAHGVNLWDANAIGMLFAILLGAAAVAALQPEARLRTLLQRQGRLGAAVGGGLGMPLFLCSACSAPVSMGLYRGGAALETSLGVIVGSALLNPVGLLAVATLMPVALLAARLLFAAYALFVLAPAVAAGHRRPEAALESPVAVAAVPGGERWGAAAAAVLRDWGRHAADMALRLGPAMLVAGFAVGLVLALLPPQQLSDLFGSAVLAVVAAAAVGTLLQLPTLFEIPLVLGTLALGLDVGAAAALLVTAPSTGAATFAVLRRDVGWRVPALMLGGTFAGGIAIGLLVSAL